MSKLAEWAYCSKCEDLVKFTVQDEIIEEVFRGVKDKEVMVKFPFRVGRCKECGHEVSTDLGYNSRRADAKWKAYRELKKKGIKDE